MELHTWLDKPSNRGKAAELADKIGISGAAVSYWRTNGVPIKHMAEVVLFTRGAVKISAMVAHAAKCQASKATA